MSADVPAQLVAHSLLKQYYQYLHDEPEKVTNMYMADSTAVRADHTNGPRNDCPTLRGPEEIAKGQADIFVQNLRTVVNSFVAVDSPAGGCLIVVHGTFYQPQADGSEKALAFTQTFLLATQSVAGSKRAGYYVKNDVLTLLKVEAPAVTLPASPAAAAQEEVEEVAEEPVQQAEVQQEEKEEEVQQEAPAAPAEEEEEPRPEWADETVEPVAPQQPAAAAAATATILNTPAPTHQPAAASTTEEGIIASEEDRAKANADLKGLLATMKAPAAPEAAAAPAEAAPVEAPKPVEKKPAWNIPKKEEKPAEQPAAQAAAAPTLADSAQAKKEAEKPKAQQKPAAPAPKPVEEKKYDPNSYAGRLAKSQASNKAAPAPRLVGVALPPSHGDIEVPANATEWVWCSFLPQGSDEQVIAAINRNIIFGHVEQLKRPGDKSKFFGYIKLSSAKAATEIIKNGITFEGSARPPRCEFATEDKIPSDKPHERAPRAPRPEGDRPPRQERPRPSADGEHKEHREPREHKPEGESRGPRPEGGRGGFRGGRGGSRGGFSGPRPSHQEKHHEAPAAKQPDADGFQTVEKKPRNAAPRGRGGFQGGAPRAPRTGEDRK